jgi:hypothetical protein
MLSALDTLISLAYTVAPERHLIVVAHIQEDWHGR